MAHGDTFVLKQLLPKTRATLQELDCVQSFITGMPGRISILQHETSTNTCAGEQYQRCTCMNATQTAKSRTGRSQRYEKHTGLVTWPAPSPESGSLRATCSAGLLSLCSGTGLVQIPMPCPRSTSSHDCYTYSAFSSQLRTVPTYRYSSLSSAATLRPAR